MCIWVVIIPQKFQLIEYLKLQRQEKEKGVEYNIHEEAKLRFIYK